MRPTPLQNPYKFKVNIRPVKIAYFVKDDDEVALSNLVRLICTQWGGLRHLLVPINLEFSVTPLYEYLLKLHEPDWFVCYFNEYDEELINQITSYLRKIFPSRLATVSWGKYFERNDDTAHVLNVIPKIELQRSHLLVPQITDQGYELTNLMVYGDIYPAQEDFYASSIGLKSTEITAGSRQFWNSQFEINPFSSVINLTSYGIGAYHVLDSFRGFDHIDVVIVQSLIDICLYWNIRALREVTLFRQENNIRRTICLPSKFLASKEVLESAFDSIQNKLFFPGRKANLDIRFHCTSHKQLEDIKLAISSITTLVPFSDPKVFGNTLGRLPNQALEIQDRPLTYSFGPLDTPKKYLEGVWWNLALLADLKFGNNEIRFDPPSEFHKQDSSSVAIDYESDIWDIYPKNFRVAEAIEGGTWFSKYGLSMVAGVRALTQFRRFKLPSAQRAIELFIESHGYQIFPSKVSQYSDAFIDLFGSFEAVKLIASKSVYQLLDLLAVKSTLKISQSIGKKLQLEQVKVDALSQFLFDQLDLPPEIKDKPRTLNQLLSDKRVSMKTKELLETINKLTKVQVLKRGFYLPCPNCGVSEWYSLQSINEFIICPGCSFEFVFPAKESDNSDSETKWHYRLNSLVNRAMDQDILVAILAVVHLTTEKDSACHMFGAEIRKDSQTKEFDFLFVSKQKIIAGECKTGSVLADKDFRTGQLAAELGFAKFYYCTVKQFDQDTMSRIEDLQNKLKEQGLQTEILTLSGNELLGEIL